MKLNNLKVVFAGCAKDCSKYIPKVLDNIKYYSSFFDQSFSIIIENGSSDNTKELLKKNKNKNDNFIFCDELNKFQYRGQRLEKARNLIIDTIRKNKHLSSCDLFIMLDLDDIGAYRINHDDISNAIKFLFSKENIGAVFANQIGFYYDIWTLRDNEYCKDDFWADVFKFLMGNKNSYDQISKNQMDKAKKEVINKKVFSFSRSHLPISVNSAFGGFGIYKMKNVIRNKEKYLGTQTFEVNTQDNKSFKVNYQKCEHVNFNQGIINQGMKLYILPYLINAEFSNLDLKAETCLKLIIK